MNYDKCILARLLVIAHFLQQDQSFYDSFSFLSRNRSKRIKEKALNTLTHQKISFNKLGTSKQLSIASGRDHYKTEKVKNACFMHMNLKWKETEQIISCLVTFIQLLRVCMLKWLARDLLKLARWKLCSYFFVKIFWK